MQRSFPIAHGRLVFSSVLAALTVAALSATHTASAAAPVLRSTPNYQTPVRAQGDDLLMIPGSGFSQTDTVVYQAITNTSLPLTAPIFVPTSPTASIGAADVVSSGDAPNSLTVRLPAVLQGSSSYAIWARNQAGEWSNGIRINDARPLWISPDFAYATQSLANLPRYLKVIGRNLEPATGQTTRVRLTGPTTLTLGAVNDGNPATAIEHYVARVNLPANLTPGVYSVEVSRDGTSWTSLAGQSFTVKPDVPAPVDTWNLQDFGCAPNDELDDTACIVDALSLMQQNQATGPLSFGPGNWILSDPNNIPVNKRRPFSGIIVPRGISLAGAGASNTTITVRASWAAATQQAAFTLLGNNSVTGFNFVDQRQYLPTDTNIVRMLKLGLRYDVANPNNPADPKQVSNVVITQNRFDKPYVAVTDDGLPLDHIYVTFNEMGSYFKSVSYSGNGNNNIYPFQVDDSIVAYNTFEPGSYLTDNPNARDGSRATEIGAGRHVDVSNNIADGSSVQFLYDAQNKGWRAGMFFHMRNNHEGVLVSNNALSCTGDRGGDGEAIAFDGNHNSTGFTSAKEVLAATATTVTVSTGTLRNTFENNNIDVATFYKQHWVQVVEGAGGGQVRKISSYTINPDSTVTFTVAPAFDTVPAVATGKIALTREYWQVYIVDNEVDHRKPLCEKSNPDEPAGGAIGYWSPAADSTIESNVQYDTSGIIMNTVHNAEATKETTAFQSHVEIRGNLIDGEYDYGSSCSWSGINPFYGASDTQDLPPPIGSFGLSIARNTIDNADGLHGGAINLALSWHDGPGTGGWHYIDNPLIFQNTISHITGTVPLPTACNVSLTNRTGVRLDDPMIWRAVLYGNSCTDVTKKLTDGGTSTVKVCSASAPANSCECSP